MKLNNLKGKYAFISHPNTNAFLNYGGYGEEKGFAPTSTKYPKIILNGIDREVKALI